MLNKDPRRQGGGAGLGVVQADLHPTLFFLLKQENVRRRKATSKEAPISVSKLEEPFEEWIQKRGGKVEL